MTRRKRSREPRIAGSLAEIAEIWGVSPQSVQQWQSQAGFPRNADGSVTIKEVLRWRYKLEDSRLVAGGGVDDLGPGDSAALERYRLARAQQEEMKLAEMQGQSFPASWVSGLLGETARTVRHAAEHLQRIGDQRAAEILSDSLSSMQQRVELAMESKNYSPQGLWGDDDAERPETETEPAAAGDPAATGV